MSARRKAVRQRDLVSYGRRTPRFDLVQLRAEAREASRQARVVELSDCNADSDHDSLSAERAPLVVNFRS